ncbi:hypothetical protein [Streptomyces acidicola]|uniref:hypothetical protein n=1 Tax=Streptomyces acidicola TaxID=2596892 RepID=UPI00382F25DD
MAEPSRVEVDDLRRAVVAVEDPVTPGPDSLLTEVNKLQRVRKLDEKDKLVTIDLDS